MAPLNYTMNSRAAKIQQQDLRLLKKYSTEEEKQALADLWDDPPGQM